MQPRRAVGVRAAAGGFHRGALAFELPHVASVSAAAAKVSGRLSRGGGASARAAARVGANAHPRGVRAREPFGAF